MIHIGNKRLKSRPPLTVRKLTTLFMTFCFCLTSVPYPLAYADTTATVHDNHPQVFNGFNGNDDNVEGLNEVNEVLKELEVAGPTDFPRNPKGVDSFHLRNQRLRVLSGPYAGTYNLGHEFEVVPDLGRVNFEKDVQIVIDPKTSMLTFVYFKRGKPFAVHEFLSLKVHRAIRDHDFVITLSETGVLMAMDAIYASEYAFKSVVPAIDLVQLQSFSDYNGQLEIGFNSRKLNPLDGMVTNYPKALRPEDQMSNPNAKLDAGNILTWIVDREGRQLGVDIIQGNAYRTEVAKAEADLAKMAYQLDPAPEKAGVMTGIDDLVRAEVDDSLALEKLHNDILAQLPADAVHRLASRSTTNLVNNHHPRDSYTLKEWQAQFAADVETAKQIVKEPKKISQTKAFLRSVIRTPADLFRSLMTAKSMKRMARIVGIGATAGTAAYEVDQIEFEAQGLEWVSEKADQTAHMGTVWATYIMNQLYNHAVPDVLKHETYRWTLLKSTIILSAGQPLMLALGQIYSKVMKVPWTAQKAIATMSMRIWATFSLLFWHRLGQLFVQPNFIRSLKLGINPFTQVTPESPLGEAIGLKEAMRPAFQNSFNLGREKEGLVQKDSMTPKYREILKDEKTHLRDLAVVLAIKAYSKQNRVNTRAFFEELQKRNANTFDMTEAKFKSILRSVEFSLAWADKAAQLGAKIHWAEITVSQDKVARANQQVTEKKKGTPSKAAHLFLSPMDPTEVISAVAADLEKQGNLEIYVARDKSRAKAATAKMINSVNHVRRRLGIIERERAAIQNAIAQQKARTRSLAWSLAVLTVGQRFKIDPATIATLMENSEDKIAIKEHVESILKSNEFKKSLMVNANTLIHEIAIMKGDRFLKVASEIDPEEMSAYIQKAQFVADKLQGYGRLRQTLNNLRSKWRNFAENAIVSFANFGVRDYQFLMTGEPTKLTIDNFWRQFTWDYLLSVEQVAVIGPRANWLDQEALAANEHSFLYTTPGHRNDMIDQIRIYMINEPARLAMVYQKQMEAAPDPIYDPIDLQSMVGRETHETFWFGMKEWTKNAMDLKSANYSSLYFRDLIKRITTLQANMIFAIAGRMVVGGQAFQAAFMGAVYSVFWPVWKYGGYWFVSGRGNQLYSERLEKLQSTFLTSKAKLASDLRADNLEEIRTAALALSDLYDFEEGKPDTALSQIMISEGFKLLEFMKPEDLARLKSDFSTDERLLTELQLALNSGSIERIERARQSLVAQYPAGDQGRLMQLTAIDLLVYSLDQPPFATKPHEVRLFGTDLASVENLTTLVTAGVTTWLGTAMFADTFRASVSMPDKLTEMAGLSPVLYASTYLLQKMVNFNQKAGTAAVLTAIGTTYNLFETMPWINLISETTAITGTTFMGLHYGEKAINKSTTLYKNWKKNKAITRSCKEMLKTSKF